MVSQDETLTHWIAKDRHWSQDQALAWIIANDAAVFGNPDEVAKWIGSLLTKYDGQPMPTALHGEDFNALVKRQRSIDERFIEALFTDPNFCAIERKVAYAGYTWILNTYGHSRYRISDQKFYDKCDHWLKKNAPHIQQTTVVWNKAKNSKSYIFHNTNKPKPYIDNREVYISDLVWIGPSLD
jgi:hypothetical protein